MMLKLSDNEFKITKINAKGFSKKVDNMHEQMGKSIHNRKNKN